MTSKPALAFALFATALALVPAVQAIDLPQGPVREVVADLFTDVSVQQLALLAACPGGAIDAVGDAIRFRETDEPGQTPPGFVAGYSATGCATATYTARVPPGTNHVHVRFQAERTVQLFQVAGLNVNTGTHFNQSVQVYADGALLREHGYFSDNASAQSLRSVEVPTTYLPTGARELQVVWSFEDRGGFGPEQLQDAPQGAAYGAVVEAPTLEFSSVPLPVLRVRQDHHVAEGVRVGELVVRFEAPGDLLSDYRADLRFRVALDYRFARFEAPDGRIVDAVGTRYLEGYGGFDRTKVLQEQIGPTDTSQVTIPWELSSRYGPGVYETTFHATTVLEPRPVLVPLAIAILAAPLPFGVAAFGRVRVFERETFGAFQRAARRLRLTLVGVTLYYLAVILSALFGGRLRLLATWPLGAQGWLLYAQVGIAIFAFVALFLVARELYSITQPKTETPPEP